MSQENVEIAREAVEAMNRRDTDAFVARLHPGVEWEETADAFSGLKGNYRGPREVRRWAEQAVVEFWPDLKMEIEEITEMSDGGVLLGTRISARGTASGVDTETHAWQSSGSRMSGSPGVKVRFGLGTKPSKPPGCRSSAWDETRYAANPSLAARNRYGLGEAPAQVFRRPKCGHGGMRV